jgi:probable F420-dependent oxidoreductase
LSDVPEIARAAERKGFDTLWSPETIHNPFLSGLLTAEHSRQLKFGTAIAVAFARSPTTMAYTAWDLAQFSRGRFILGLGTQVKAHIERRFGLPWPDSVAGKLREQIHVMRAIWNTWQTGEPLRHRGEYYKLTLMSPFFNPGPIEYPNIPIYIAGVNTGLARLSGEIADGFHVHPLHSQKYLKEILVPAFDDGSQKVGRPADEHTISATVFVVTSESERGFVRSQIAFYASTPSYRPVLALHGWGETAERLTRLAARGKWSEMPELIDDEMVETFAVICNEGDLADMLRQRYSGILDRLHLYKPFIPGEDDDFWQNLADGMS